MLYSVQHREVELQMRYSFCVNHSHLAGCGAFHCDSNILYETLLYLTPFARSHSVIQTALSQQELCHVYCSALFIYCIKLTLMHKATVNINFQGTSKADHRCIQQLSAAQKKKKSIQTPT